MFRFFTVFMSFNSVNVTKSELFHECINVENIITEDKDE